MGGVCTPPLDKGRRLFTPGGRRSLECKSHASNRSSAATSIPVRENPLYPSTTCQYHCNHFFHVAFKSYGLIIHPHHKHARIVIAWLSILPFRKIPNIVEKIDKERSRYADYLRERWGWIHVIGYVHRRLIRSNPKRAINFRRCMPNRQLVGGSHTVSYMKRSTHPAPNLS